MFKAGKAVAKLLIERPAEPKLDAARHAPNGANRQPWHFVAVADPAFGQSSANLLASRLPDGLAICPISYVELAPVFGGDRLAEEQASSDYMAGVTFGRELFRSGEWEGLVKGGWPVAEALNALAAPRNSVVSR